MFTLKISMRSRAWKLRGDSNRKGAPPPSACWFRAMGAENPCAVLETLNPKPFGDGAAEALDPKSFSSRSLLRFLSLELLRLHHMGRVQGPP